MKTIGIIGTRRRDTPEDYKKVHKAFFSIFNNGDQICSGGCPKGGDKFADQIARSVGIPILTFYAAWDVYGRSAGFKRNGLIAKASDILIACVSEDRKGGTEDTIKKFKRGKPENTIIIV